MFLVILKAAVSCLWTVKAKAYNKSVFFSCQDASPLSGHTAATATHESQSQVLVS